MKPRIDGAAFGSITIDGTTYEHDVIIRPSGKIKKRKKQLSKARYRTSHVISLEEAEHVYRKGADRLIIGTGQEGLVKLSDEAEAYFHENECEVQLLPTPQAIQAWNDATGAVLGLFHVTC